MYACVAQLVVQLIRNEQVAGSSPVTSSIFLNKKGDRPQSLIFGLLGVDPKILYKNRR